MAVDGQGGNTGLGNALLGNSASAAVRLQHPLVRVEVNGQKDQLLIYWTVPTFPTDRYWNGFNVYRSNSPQTPLGQSDQISPLNTVPITVTFFLDITAEDSLREVYWYTVTGIEDDGSETPLTDPVALEQMWSPSRATTIMSMPRILLEFIRRKNIVLSRDGEPCDILLRKRAGTLCSCYDCDYEAASDPSCPECFGTTFQGGYDVMKDVLVRVLTISEVLARVPKGLQFRSNPRAWLVNYPVLSNGDVIVRRNRYRYEVNQLDLRSTQALLTEQNFELVQLETSNPVYEVPLVTGDVTNPAP